VISIFIVLCVREGAGVASMFCPKQEPHQLFVPEPEPHTIDEAFKKNQRLTGLTFKDLTY
jgi:hypothetical protein